MNYILLGLLAVACVVTQFKVSAAPQLFLALDQDGEVNEEYIPVKREVVTDSPLDRKRILLYRLDERTLDPNGGRFLHKREIGDDLNPLIDVVAYESILGKNIRHKREISDDLNSSIRAVAAESVLGKKNPPHKREISDDLDQSLDPKNIRLKRDATTRLAKCVSPDVAGAAARGAVGGAGTGPPGAIAGAIGGAVSECSTKL